jgi:hypothetical protein
MTYAPVVILMSVQLYYTVRLPTAALPGKKWGIYREAARGVQNTSSDFTNDSISFWWSGIPTTVML